MEHEQIEHKSFLLYKDKKPLIDSCTDIQAGQLFKAIYRYAVTGETADLENNLLNGILAVFCEAIEKDDKAYLKKCETNRDNGKKGGRPRKNPIKPDGFSAEPTGTRTKAKKADNDNDNDNDNDRNIGKKPKKAHTFNDFEQNKYDFEALEQELAHVTNCTTGDQ